MKRDTLLLSLGVWAGMLLGCSQAPVLVPVDSLAFPVVLIVGTKPSNEIPHRARVIAGRSGLDRMRVELYSPLTDTTLADPPIVIDSNAAILDMKDIKGEHGGMWMMANPTGLMPISYNLIRREQTGIEAARGLVADCQFIGYDLDEERRKLRSERIRHAQSMADIVRIVDEMPETAPVP